MKKKLITLLLALGLSCACVGLIGCDGSIMRYETYTEDGFVYQGHGDCFVVKGYVGADTEVVIRDTYKGLPVTGIVGAFSGCKNLKSITIPDSVTSIDRYAFKDCDGLTSITIPDSVTSIGYEAFYGCSNLTSITIPDSVTEIGWYAFKDCDGLTSITIPDSVTEIGMSAFEDCDGLTSITIPDSVTGIGSSTFKDCDGLTSITIPDSVTWIGWCAFDSCDGLTSIHYTGTIDQWAMIDFNVSSSNPLSYAGYLYINGEEVTEVNLTTATYISDYAFYGYNNLTSVTIGNSVTSIGDHAFEDCDGLTSVTIGNGVTSIGDGAFYSCDKLIEVINKSSLTITEGSYGNGYVALGAKQVITDAAYSNIIKQNDYIFYNDNETYYLMGYTGEETDLVLPDTINGHSYAIYQFAFYDCSNLTSVTIGNGVTEIGNGAFRNCSKLTSITIPDSVTEIGGYAFEDCSNLTSVTIGNGVTSIGSGAFYDYDNLTEVYYYGTESEWNTISIGYNNSYLTKATRYYYSETQPTTSGNYWHYVNGVVTKW